MKELIKRYLDRGISRRGFLSGLAATGISATAAKTMASSLAPFLASPQTGMKEGADWIRPMRGTGAALLVEQLKASGVQYLFTNPAAGGGPVYDVLVDDPTIEPIKALHEGSLGAMADGYAKASGKTPFVMMASPGLPNCMTQMFNSWKDQIPMVVAVDSVSPVSAGREGFEDADNLEDMPAPITKWHWAVEMPEKIPEITRRAMQFATTPPSGPVFVGYTGLGEEAEAAIMDQSKFAVLMKIRPDPALVEQAARILLDANSPLLYVGDEIVRCGAQKEVLELAELLGLPVMRPVGIMGWSKPFPTAHPLYVGEYFSQLRYPQQVDVMLNLGSRMPYSDPRMEMLSSVKLIQVRQDPSNITRLYPAEVAMVADLKLALTDLLAAIRSMATPARLKQISEPRLARTREFTTPMREYRRRIALSRGDRSPVDIAWLGIELENVLDKNTCFVAEMDSGRTMEALLNFGGDDKQFFNNGGRALGWGISASLGVKLAHPDRPVVAVVGDGAFNFSGPQPFWSFARYQAGVTVIVLNNGSYDNERNRMWARNGRQAQSGRDMICYMGNPDIDYVKVVSGYGVEGEVVKEPSQVRPALERAKRAMAQGSPYLLDVHIARMGKGSQSTWHPPFTVGGVRRRT